MSKMQGAKESTYFEQVNDTHKKNRFYKKPKGLRNDEGFTVKHYAGDVAYDTAGFAEANRDELGGNQTARCLQGAVSLCAA